MSQQDAVTEKGKQNNDFINSSYNINKLLKKMLLKHHTNQYMSKNTENTEHCSQKK